MEVRQKLVLVEMKLVLDLVALAETEHQEEHLAWQVQLVERQSYREMHYH